MDDEVNVTYITLHGHVELNKYRALYFLIMFTIFILIICCNSIIVCLIWIHKNLHEPMYIFIAALLLNSVLFSTAIYPNICKPLQYHIIMKKTRVSILLVLAWPACHVVVTLILITENKLCNFTVKAIFCNNAIYGLQCVQSRVITIYGVVPLLDLIVLPVVFIVFTYTKILIITHGSCREVRTKAAETCLPHLLVLICVFCFSVYDISIARVESNLPTTARLIMTLQKVLYHPLFNPLIYGLKMKEIFKHLKRLFCPTKII